MKEMIEHNPTVRYGLFTYDLPWTGPKNAAIPFTLTLKAAYTRVVRGLPITDLLVAERAPSSLVKRFSDSSRVGSLIQAENLWAAPIALKARVAAQRLVATFHDAYSDRIRELLAYFKASEHTIQETVGRVVRLEKSVIPELDACVFVSQVDLDHYRELDVDVPSAYIVPNGVDTEKFKPLDYKEAYVRKYGLNGGTRILFTGSDMYQNRQAVDVIAQTLKLVYGFEYQVVVAGSVSQYAQKRLAQSGVRVKALGYVDSLQEVYCASDIVFAPLVSGTGTKLKILEAMACAKPVLTTSKGTRGLEVGDACLVAHDTTEMAAKLRELASDPQLRENLGRKARRTAQKYDWRVLMPLYTQVYEELLHAKILGDPRKAQ